MEFGFQRGYFQGVQASEQLALALPFQILLQQKRILEGSYCGACQYSSLQASAPPPCNARDGSIVSFQTSSQLHGRRMVSKRCAIVPMAQDCGGCAIGAAAGGERSSKNC